MNRTKAVENLITSACDVVRNWKDGKVDAVRVRDLDEALKAIDNSTLKNTDWTKRYGVGIPANAACLFKNGINWNAVLPDYIDPQNSPIGVGQTMMDAALDLFDQAIRRLRDSEVATLEAISQKK